MFTIANQILIVIELGVDPCIISSSIILWTCDLDWAFVRRKILQRSPRWVGGLEMVPRKGVALHSQLMLSQCPPFIGISVLWFYGQNGIDVHIWVVIPTLAFFFFILDRFGWVCNSFSTNWWFIWGGCHIGNVDWYSATWVLLHQIVFRTECQFWQKWFCWCLSFLLQISVPLFASFSETDGFPLFGLTGGWWNHS